MLLNVRAELIYEFTSPTQVLMYIEAAKSGDQAIESETLSLGPSDIVVRDFDDRSGARQVRTILSGTQRIAYGAQVDNGMRGSLPRDAKEHAWTNLPLECLPFLLPSRFCPSDKFMRFAEREFAAIKGGGNRVHAVLDWIREHVDYVHGVSTAETTAERTFVDRAGVCRDFTHLGITLCRALGIPARAVSAYAWKLDPPDFHAVFEVFLSGRWWLVDPTGLAPVEGIVRIASGRDAADIAFMSTDGSCECKHLGISVTQARDDNGMQATPGTRNGLALSTGTRQWKEAAMPSQKNDEAIIARIAGQNGVSEDAVRTVLDALRRGGGTMAQFSHADFGGMSQWTRGMTMVGDMFNDRMKSTLDAVASELADYLKDNPGTVPVHKDQDASYRSHGGGWWPKGLGSPSSTGAQNDLRYAVFPESRRLVIDDGGRQTVYDTGDHRIGGVSQAQSSDRTISFTSQNGLVRLEDLKQVED